MVTFQMRLRRVGLLIGLIAALVSGPAIDPSQTMAKPFSSGGPGGEPYGTGDPTGDDLPSPTPKPNSRAARWGSQETVQAGSALAQRHGRLGISGRWNLYLRLLARLAVR